MLWSESKTVAYCEAFLIEIGKPKTSPFPCAFFYTTAIIVTNYIRFDILFSINDFAIL